MEYHQQLQTSDTSIHEAERQHPWKKVQFITRLMISSSVIGDLMILTIQKRLPVRFSEVLAGLIDPIVFW